MPLCAVIQLSCTSDEGHNLEVAESLVREAAGHGAELIATPECTNYLGPHDEKVRRAEPLDGPLGRRLSRLARETGATLLIGSVNERSEDPQRCYNTSVVYGPQGGLLGSYRKLHMFDVDIPGGVRFSESATCGRGERVAVVDTPVGRIGLSICYDLRFPELYRAMVDRGAQILAVPSAFTLRTGRDHWHPLLRARAIETQCYVLAPGQHGRHGDQGLVESYGHSMIIDPWGHITGMAADGVGIAYADLDLDRVAAVRRSIPVQQHRHPLLQSD